MVRGACSERHVGQRRVLTGRGSHARTVGHVDVLAGMDLVPGIEYRRLWITAHTRSAHLVDAETHADGAIKGTYVAVASGCQHLGGVVNHVLAHADLVLLQARIECEHGQTKLI